MTIYVSLLLYQYQIACTIWLMEYAMNVVQILSYFKTNAWLYMLRIVKNIWQILAVNIVQPNTLIRETMDIVTRIQRSLIVKFTWQLIIASDVWKVIIRLRASVIRLELTLSKIAMFKAKVINVKFAKRDTLYLKIKKLVKAHFSSKNIVPVILLNMSVLFVKEVITNLKDNASSARREYRVCIVISRIPNNAWSATEDFSWIIKEYAYKIKLQL